MSVKEIEYHLLVFSVTLVWLVKDICLKISSTILGFPHVAHYLESILHALYRKQFVFTSGDKQSRLWSRY